MTDSDGQLGSPNGTIFRLRLATMDDLDSILALQNSVAQGLPYDMFATDGPDFYDAILNRGGQIMLAEEEGQPGTLAGASVIRFPCPDEEENLARNAGLEKDCHARARHLESVFISKSHQGVRLAEHLIRANMQADSSGRDLSLATVWPLNLPSLRLHLGLGLYVRSFALKYGGRPRFILASGPEQPDFDAEAVLIPLTELFEDHQKMLTYGMAGTALLRGNSGPMLEYRPLNK
ncbi:MAG: hypothetical protein IJ034_04300 [Mailhella sp.]|nr:hypothetical protein [Mailhella sp.]